MRTLGSWSSHLRQGPHFHRHRWLGSIRWKPPIRQGDHHHRCLHCSCWCLGIAPLRWSNHRRPSRRRRLRGRGGRIHRPKLPKQLKGRGTKPLARSSFSFSCFFHFLFVLVVFTQRTRCSLFPALRRTEWDSMSGIDATLREIGCRQQGVQGEACAHLIEQLRTNRCPAPLFPCL